MTEQVELVWGLRGSFLTYIDGLRDGVVRAEDGATRDGEVFRLPGRAGDAVEYAFDGTLRFFGHHGALDVILRQLLVGVDGDGTGVVSAEVSGVRVALATLAGASRDAGGSLGFADVVFTDDGAALLGGVYSAGAPADPVTIRVTT